MNEQAPFTLKGRNPDVLTCIANLSNDEVFTPPEFANRMLDTLQDRDAALAALTEALNEAAGAGTWAYVPSPDASALPPTADQDFIRTAFIYKP